MSRRGKIITLIRRAPFGVVPVLILAFTAITGILIPEGNYSDEATILVLLVCSGFAAYSYMLVNDTKIFYVQIDPESESPARTHYSNEFELDEGYSEFDAFVNIPKWMNKFILEFDPDSPLEVGLWEVPDDYNENGNTIECSDNAHDFSFILTVGGDVDELGTADRELRIYEKETNSKLTTLTLISTNTQADDSYRDQFKNDG